jgi:hypothetical protein
MPCLQGLALSSPGLPEQQFLANRWLATGEGDGQTYCTLYPGGANAPQLHKYRVVVTTSDIRGAGTDARVFVTLFGSASSAPVGPLWLDNSKNNFERAQVDEFRLELPDLGEVGTALLLLLLAVSGDTCI